MAIIVDNHEFCSILSKSMLKMSFNKMLNNEFQMRHSITHHDWSYNSLCFQKLAS